MDVSTLSILVKSEGVAKAAADLDKLAQSAKSAEDATSNLAVSQKSLTANTKALSAEEAKRNLMQKQIEIVNFNAATRKYAEAQAEAISINKQLKASEEQRNLIQQKRDTEAYNVATKAYVQAQAEAAAATRALAAEEQRRSLIQQKRDLETYNTSVKANAVAVKEAADAQKAANKVKEDAINHLKNLNGSGSIWNNTLKSMAVAASAYVGVNFAKNVIEQADAWGQMGAKLKIATGSIEGAKAAQEGLFDIAQRLRIPLEDSVQLFTRMSLPLTLIGKSAKETMGVVEGMGLALKLSGATAQEASSVMLQFSQSMNSGRLNGGEFNAVAEGAPIVLRAIEAELKRVGMGAELATKGLKKMGSDGKISSEIMANAILNARAKMEEDFASLPLTVDGAMTRIKNAWTAALGAVAEDTKFTEKMAKALKTFEDMMPDFAKIVGGAFAFIVENGNAIITVLEAIAGVAALATLGKFATAVVDVGIAFKAAGAGAEALRAAFVGLGLTPLGAGFIAVAAAAWGVHAAMKAVNEEAEREQKRVDDRIQQFPKLLSSMDAETKQLQKQVDLIREKAGLPALYGNTDKFTSVTPMKEEVQISYKLRQAKDDLAITEQKLAKWNEENTKLITNSNGKQDAAILKSLAKGSALEKELAANKKIVEVAEAANKAAQEKVPERDTAQKEVKLASEMAKDLELRGKIKDTLLTKDDKEIAKLQELVDKAKARNKEDQAATIPLKEIAALEAKIAEIRAKQAPTQTKAKVSLDPVHEANRLLKEQTELEERLAKGEFEDRKLTNSEKVIIKWKEQIAQLEEVVKGTDNSAKASAREEIAVRKTAIALLENMSAREKASEAADKAIKDRKKENDDLDKTVEGLMEENAVLQQSIDNHGKLAKSKTEVALEEAKLEMARLISLDGYDKEIEKQQRIINLLEEKKVLQGQREEQVSTDQAQKELDKLLDPTKAQSFGDALKESFNGAAGGISKLVTALTSYGRKAAEIEKERKLWVAAGSKDDANKIEIMRRQDAMTVSAYGDMAAAAKGFFKEGSNGYKALEAAEKTFRAVEMAMAIENTVKKSGLVEAFTALFLGSKTTEMAATEAAATTEIATTEAVSQVKAVGNVINQGGGDPYSAFARMAAMAAAMAALGFAVAGGSSGVDETQTASYRQKVQGTGTILGDSSAKSDSINKSLEYLNKLSEDALSHTVSMDNSLKQLVSGIAGLSQILVRTSGITTGKDFNIVEGQINKGMPTDTISKVMTSVTNVLFGPGLGGAISGFINNLWGKTTQSIVDAGLAFKGTVADLTKGLGLSQYANVQTITSSWFGLKKDPSYSTVSQGVDKQIQDQFAKVFTGLQDTLTLAAKGLGIDAEQVKKSIDALVVDSSISLKGLSGQELTNAINSVISKVADQMASGVLPGLDEFQKVGEGTFETLVRISSDLTAVNDVFSMLGRNTLALNKSGLTTAETLIDLYGSLDNFRTISQEYFKNYYTEQEQNKINIAGLTSAFKDLGMELPDSKEKLRTLIEEAQALGTTAGDETAVKLMKLSGVFFTVSEQSAKLADDLATKEKEKADKLKEIADQKAGLEIQILRLLGKESEAVAAERKIELDAMDASLRPLQERINKLTDEAAAAEKAKELANQKFDLEIQILNLTGKEAEATARQRKKELDAMDASLRPLQERINALQDAKAAEEAAKKATEDAQKARELQIKEEDAAWSREKDNRDYFDKQRQEQQDAVKKAIDEQAASYQKLIDKFSAFSKAVKTLKESLLTGNLTTLSPEESYQRVKNNLQSTIASAQGGDTEALNQLQQFLEISKGYNASTQAYTDDFNTVTNALDSMAAGADTQEAIAKAQLQALQTSNGNIVGVIGAVNQVNSSITTGLSNLATSIVAGQQATYAEAKKQFEVNTGSNVDLATSLVGKGVVGGDVSYTNERLRAYNAFTPPQSQVEQATKIIDDLLAKYNTSGIDTSIRTKNLAGAEQYNRQDYINTMIDSLQGSRTTQADIERWIKQQFGIDGSHENGLDYVPFDGYRAELHQGEAVLTSNGVQGMVEGMKHLCSQMSEAITELKANVAVNSTGAQMVVEKLDTLATKLDDQKRVLART